MITRSDTWGRNSHVKATLQSESYEAAVSLRFFFFFPSISKNGIMRYLHLKSVVPQKKKNLKVHGASFPLDESIL